MSRLKRPWLVALVSLAALFSGGTLFLHFSPVGSQFIWSQLQRWVPELKGEWVSGSLADGWELRNTEWQNEFVTVSLDHVQVRWSWASLLRGKVAIASLDVDGLTVTRHHVVDAANVATTAETDGLAREYFSSPLPIEIQQLNLSHFVYDDPVVTVAIKSLNTGAMWQAHRITIQPSQSESVDVWLKASQPEQAVLSALLIKKASQDVSADKHLPAVFVPFDIILNQLNVQQGRYHQQGFDTGLMDISLQARFDGSVLTVQKALVKQAHRQAELIGQMTFVQNYLLDTTLKIQSALPFFSPARPREMTLTAKGDLQQMMLNAALDGDENVHLQGNIKPLTVDVPFEIKGDWLRWPLPETLPMLSIGKGKFDARGSWRNYQLKFESAGQWQGYPATQLQFALRGTNEQLVLQQAKWTDGINQLVSVGELSWQKGLHWQGQSDFHLVDVTKWLPQLNAKLSGTIKQTFDWQQDSWQAALSNISLNGQWNGFPLAAQGAIHGDDRGRWQFQQFVVENGPNTLTLNGVIDKQWSLAGTLRAPKLSTIDAQWDGSLDGDFRFNGAAKAPVLAFRVAAPRLVLLGQFIRELEITGHATLDQKLSAQFQLHANRWNWRGSRLQNVVLTLSGNASQHQMRLSAEGKQLNGSLLVNGEWRNNRWQGQLHDGFIGGLAGLWRLNSPVAMQWQNKVFGFKSHCWLSAPAQLCFADASIAASRGTIPVTLSDLDSQRLTPWLPDGLQWQSKLQASGLLGWRGSVPDVALKMRSQQGEFITDQIHTPYRDLSLQLGINSKLAQLTFLLDSDMLGKADITAQVIDPLKQRQLGGSVNLSNLQLYGVAPLVDALHQTKGRVDIHGRLAGTLAAPLFYGRAQLQDGEIDTETDMLSLRQINGSLLINGDNAELNANLLAGKGKATLTGHAQWPDGAPSGVLALRGREMTVAFAGYGNGRVDSDLQVQFDALQASLSGEVMVPWARIDIKSLPDNGIEISDDVHIVRPLQPQRQSAPFPFSMDVDLRLGSDIQFNAMGLKTALGGGLRFRQKPEQNMITQGEIRLVNGRFKAYGQNLVIRSGKLLFNGDVTEPYVMAEAIRDPATMEDTSVTVGVKINAPINAISAQVFSEPELPDTDKLSYLLRGRSSTATTNGSTEESMAAMMIGAGLGQTNGVVSDVASTFGLKDAGFDTSGSGTDTKVNLSAYLLKDLQLQYGVGVYSAVSEVKLKYFLLPQLYLQAVSNLEQAVDLFYKFEF